ncbi:MAG TPA: hypothetical protein VLI55_20835 [Bryobacteraceae bacterium]|nr:hypothetical protein [Bryobacteraceae bacterium]
MGLATLLPVAVSMIPSGSALRVPRHGLPVASPTAAQPACGIECGKERWAVKTMSDPGASMVTLTAVPTTVGALVTTPAPTIAAKDIRVNQIEKQAFTVHAKLIGFKQELQGTEGDHDFHIVLQDLNSADTMIIEIPSPACQGVCDSTVQDRIQTARNQFSAAFPKNPPGPEFLLVDGAPTVEVTGVGMFDFFHRQTGVARNCIELHPVLDIQFPPPGTFNAHHDSSHDPKPGPDSDYHCMPK